LAATITKKLTYISILTASSVVLIVLLSSFTPLAIYPSIRIAFEGILIKLTGYLFGPFFGFITAILTECLLLLLRPGIVHWSYTVAIMFFSLIGGLAYILKRNSKISKYISHINNAVILLISIISIILSIFIIPNHVKFLNFFDKSGGISKWIIFAYIWSFLFIILLFNIFWQIKQKNNNDKLFSNEIFPILFLCLLTEIITIFLISYGNSKTISSGVAYSYTAYIAASLGEMPIRFFVNIIIIYTVWKILHPLIKIKEYSQTSVFLTKNNPINKSNTRTTENKILKIISKYPHKKSHNSNKKMVKVFSEIGVYDYLDKIKKIQIVGTNGKTSVSYYLSNTLSKKYVVGTFISPHIYSMRERIQVNSKHIPYKDILLILNSSKNIIDKYKLNFFECMFLVSVIYFKKINCNVVIFESGIGAKWDSTTSMNYDYGVLTSISLDHEKLLGKGIEKIANNKKYICLANTVYASIKDKKLLKIFQNFSKKNNNKLFDIIENIDVSENKKFTIIKTNKDNVYKFPKEKISSISNISLAISLLESMGMSFIDISNNIINNNPPCRREWVNNKILFDGAHNQDGLKHIINYFSNIKSKKVILFTIKKSKDVRGMIDIINKSNIEFYYFCPDEEIFYSYKSILEINPNIKIKYNYSEFIKDNKSKILITGSLLVFNYIKKMC